MIRYEKTVLNRFPFSGDIEYKVIKTTPEQYRQSLLNSNAI